ncbi:MAG TPA: hypothetical protein VLH16_03770 [Bacteroidales bacterium]|nr:hypothetical protein [Bacteroidales bacterium]
MIKEKFESLVLSIDAAWLVHELLKQGYTVEPNACLAQHVPPTQMAFTYGRRDHINLITFDDTDTTIRFVLFPVKEINTFGDAGFVEKTTWSGSFIVLKKSSLDEYYNEQKGDKAQGKYELHIKPIKILVERLLILLSCENKLLVQKWDISEVINMLDMNGDGVLVNFQIATP